MIRRTMSICVLCCIATMRAPAETASPVRTLEGLVREWSDLRGEIANEQRAWVRTRRQLERDIELLETEATSRASELERDEDSATVAAKDRARLAARRQAMRQALDDLRPALDRAEADLRAWRLLVPVPLRRPVEAAFDRIPQTQAQSDARSVAQRIQAVAGLYAEIESIQHVAHVVRQVLDVGGERREVDILYLGLAAGFAVSGDNEWAARGRPDEAGWTWEPAPALASSVRQAIRVYTREQPSQLVPLPLGVSGEGGTP